MAPEQPTPGYEHEQDFFDVNRLQLEAAKAAADVSTFRSGFRRRMEAAVAAGADRAQFAKRSALINSFAGSMGDLKIGDMPESNFLGRALIGGGRGSVLLSNERFGNMQTAKDVREMMQAGGHELGHAAAVQLHGELVFDRRKEDDHLIMHEGFAEKKGNKTVGMSINEHRDGQPAEVYREGQKLIAEITRVVGEALVDRVFTQTGDLSDIQAVLDKKGRGRTRAQTEPSYAMAS